METPALIPRPERTLTLEDPFDSSIFPANRQIAFDEIAAFVDHARERTEPALVGELAGRDSLPCDRCESGVLTLVFADLGEFGGINRQPFETIDLDLENGELGGQSSQCFMQLPRFVARPQCVAVERADRGHVGRIGRPDGIDKRARQGRVLALGDVDEVLDRRLPVENDQNDGDGH